MPGTGRRHAARPVGAVVLAGLAIAAACGSPSDSTPSTAGVTVAVATLPPTAATTVPPRPSTAAPTAPPTTTPTTAPEPTTTAPEPAPTAPIPPTTLPPLPVPVAPPPDDGSTEPLIGIGTIEIPAIGIERPMFEGIRLATIDHGPGHWPGTAMPGDLGNVVVAGHRVSHNADFAELDRLVPGDTVVLASLAGRFEYRVTSTEIVGPQAIHIVDQTFERRATLFACHPPGSIEERIVVHLELATPAA